MPSPTRHRIVRHVRVRAGDLVPHELNPRRHPDAQRQALEDLYREVGFARSLLAYALPDGRLKLIDGHLRRDLDPDREVEVEVLDVTEEEARALLLSIDPLAALAEQQEQLYERLRELTPAGSEELEAAWHASTEAYWRAVEPVESCGADALGEQWYVLVTCRDERQQTELLGRFQAEGLACKAVLG